MADFQARLHFLGLLEKIGSGRRAVDAVASALLKGSPDQVLDNYANVKRALAAEACSTLAHAVTRPGHG